MTIKQFITALEQYEGCRFEIQFEAKHPEYIRMTLSQTAITRENDLPYRFSFDLRTLPQSFLTNVASCLNSIPFEPGKPRKVPQSLSKFAESLYPHDFCPEIAAIELKAGLLKKQIEEAMEKYVKKCLKEQEDIIFQRRIPTEIKNACERTKRAALALHDIREMPE